MQIVKYENFLPQKMPPGAKQGPQLYRVVVTKSSTEEKAAAIRYNVDKIVLIVDVSGSMMPVLSMLKDAILSTVDLIIARQICSVDDIVLIEFGSHVLVCNDFKTVEDIRKTVLEMDSLGGTDYNCALEKLLEVVQENEKVVAVMFSDGVPVENDYKETIETLRQLAQEKYLLVHSIGLFSDYYCDSDGNANITEQEIVLRSLASVGSEEGYYQTIKDDEIEYSMIVLVDHFNPDFQALHVNNIRIRSDGFFVENHDQEHFLVEGTDAAPENEIKKCTDVRTIDAILENNLFDEALLAFRFILQYYLKNITSYSRVLRILENVVSMVTQLKDTVERNINEKKIALNDEKANQIRELKSGCSMLKEKSQIIAQYNRQFTKLLKDHAAVLGEVVAVNELCSSLSEKLHLRRCYDAPRKELADEIAKAVSRFRDNTIALKRKKLAKFSYKLQTKNANSFGNIGQLLQKEMDELITEFADSAIPVPGHLENYVDPLSLNDIREVMLDKFGVFMLVLNVERHDAGIVAPHRTKIVEVCSYSSCVLSAMMNHDEAETNLVIDFRGIGQGNAAVPLWVNDVHWRKARHVFAPFVGHAVTGHEMEYSKIQGQTILALIVLHFRRLQQQQRENGEYHRQMLQMVGETLTVVVEKKHWTNIMENVINSEESLNEEKIPSVDVFLTFLEYSQPPQYDAEKFHLLIAEDYKRRNARQIREKYEKYNRGPTRETEKEGEESTDENLKTDKQKNKKPKKANRRRFVLMTRFSGVCKTYFNYSYDEVLEAFKASCGEDGSRKRKTAKNYAKYNILGNEKYLKNECEKISKKQSAGSPLITASIKLGPEQIRAIVLSVHKCVCFGWDAFAGVGIPSGYSTSPEYRDQLFGWCEQKKRQEDADADEREMEEEDYLLSLLQARDTYEANPWMQEMKRNSLAWGVLLKVLFHEYAEAPAPGATEERPWQTEEGKKEKIPMRFELIMYCIFNSFDPADYRADKMVWRPKASRRRRFQKMYPFEWAKMSDWF